MRFTPPRLCLALLGVIGVASCVLFVVGSWQTILYHGHGYSCGLWLGSVRYVHYGPKRGPLPVNGGRWDTGGNFGIEILPTLRWQNPQYRVIHIPLWPSVPLTACWAWCVWRRHARERRISRGLCGACGYDLQGLKAGAACPECGGKAGG